MCHHKRFGVHKIWTVWVDLFVKRLMTGALDQSAGLFFIGLTAKKYGKEGRSWPGHDRFFSYSNHIFG